MNKFLNLVKRKKTKFKLLILVLAKMDARKYLFQLHLLKLVFQAILMKQNNFEHIL